MTIDNNSKNIDFNAVSKDVAPFIFFKKDVQKIRHFPEWINQAM